MSSKSRSQNTATSFSTSPPNNLDSFPSSYYSSGYSSQPRFDRSTLQMGKSKKQQFQLSEHDKREIKESFELFDTKKQGRLDYYELKVCFVQLLTLYIFFQKRSQFVH